MPEYGPYQDSDSYYNPVGASGTDYTPETPGWSGGGGSGFDYNGLVSGITSNLGNWFGGIAALVNATNGNGGYNPYAGNPFGNPNTGYGSPYGPQPQQPTTTGISGVTIAAGTILLILIILVIYLVIKQGKKS